ncbi:MAG: DeoR/GlpR transcriptional regulator [Verrucomicrobia bacterium]|nr:DeoR/GlpR transcriptional regulator [Prolixibacteraceae bacterium]
MARDQNISTVERRRIIMEQLHKNKQVDVSALKDCFHVSEVTLRKDLRYLENKKLLIRSRGGAMLAIKVGEDLSVKKRMVLNLDLKKAIASAAKSLIKEGDTIILDSGTTIMQLASHLENTRNLTVITNALDIAMKLSGFNKLKIIVPGGIVRKRSCSLVGVAAVENFQVFRADKYFISADGITGDGLFTSNLEEGQIAKIIMSNAKENIVLIDSSKFGRTGIINFAQLPRIHTLVTDKNIPPNYLTQLREAGIHVVLADD